MGARYLVLVALSLATSSVALPSAAQTGDLRSVHQRAVLATVRITGPGFSGSGWLLQQNERPVVVTNKHIAGAARRFRVHFYRGASRPEVTVDAERLHVAREIDLGVLKLLDDAPDSARPVQLRSDTQVVRGERVVLSGNPGSVHGVLPFQTTEGVVTGHIAGRQYDPCGPRRNCIVVDAAHFQGSSGGPAFNRGGRLVGMIWGGPVQAGAAATVNRRREVSEGVSVRHSSAFAYLIHPAVIAAELRRLER